MNEHTAAIGSMLEEVTTTEARLVVTATVLLATLVIGFVLVPIVVRRAVHSVGRRLEESEAGSLLETIDELLSVPFPMRAVVRTIQSAILLAAVLVGLVVWGYLDVATTILTVLGAAVPYALRILLTVGLLGGAIVGTRYLEERLDDWLADANYVTAHQEGVVFRVLQVTIFVAVGLSAISLWGVDLGGLLVGAGFLGIVMGMAAQQTLGSLIAGFVLMFARPFEIGDWVEVGDFEGMVIDITIINTRLRSFDGEIIVLPNDEVSSATVVNRSKRDRLRLTLEVGVDYETDLAHAEDVAIEAMESVEDVSPAPKPKVVPTAFGDSAITLECRFWIRQPNAHRKWTTIQSVMHELKAAYDREEIGIPYPQRELSARSGGGLRAPGDERERRETELSYDERE